MGVNNDELNDLYWSQNIIWVVKSRKDMGEACSTYEGPDSCKEGFGGGT
jgi:hypothetical protein